MDKYIRKYQVGGEDRSKKISKIKRSRKGTQLNFLDNPVSESTHKMAYAEVDGKYHVYPTLFQDEQGNWYPGGYDEARKKDEVYIFDTEEEAAKWAGPNAPWKTEKFGPGYRNGGLRKKYEEGGQSIEEEKKADYQGAIDWFSNYLKSGQYQELLKRTSDIAGYPNHMYGYRHPSWGEIDYSVSLIDPGARPGAFTLAADYEQKKFMENPAGNIFYRYHGDVGSHYNKNTGKIAMGIPHKEVPWFTQYNIGTGMTHDSILAHELGHTDKNWITKDEDVKNYILSKNKLVQEGRIGYHDPSQPDLYHHDAAANETRADLIQLRYELEKAGIFKSTGKKFKEFKKKHLKKAKETDGVHQRLFKIYSDEDIINLMNNIAQVDPNSISDDINFNTMQAKKGGIRKKYKNGGELKEVESKTDFKNGGENTQISEREKFLKRQEWIVNSGFYEQEIENSQKGSYEDRLALHELSKEYGLRLLSGSTIIPSKLPQAQQNAVSKITSYSELTKYLNKLNSTAGFERWGYRCNEFGVTMDECTSFTIGESRPHKGANTYGRDGEQRNPDIEWALQNGILPTVNPFHNPNWRKEGLFRETGAVPHTHGYNTHTDSSGNQVMGRSRAGIPQSNIGEGHVSNVGGRFGWLYVGTPAFKNRYGKYFDPNSPDFFTDPNDDMFKYFNEKFESQFGDWEGEVDQYGIPVNATAEDITNYITTWHPESKNKYYQNQMVTDMKTKWNMKDEDEPTHNVYPYGPNESFVFPVYPEPVKDIIKPPPPPPPPPPPEPVKGCMDNTAENYNPKAVIEDGSCIFKTSPVPNPKPIEPIPIDPIPNVLPYGPVAIPQPRDTSKPKTPWFQWPQGSKTVVGNLVSGGKNILKSPYGHYRKQRKVISKQRPLDFFNPFVIGGRSVDRKGRRKGRFLGIFKEGGERTKYKNGGLPFGIEAQGFSNIDVKGINWGKGVEELKGTESRQGVNVSGINLSKDFKLGKNLNLSLSNPAAVYARPTLDNMPVSKWGAFKALPFEPRVSLSYNFKEGGERPKNRNEFVYDYINKTLSRFK